jgi:tyrosyl-tRNA synthetase
VPDLPAGVTDNPEREAAYLLEDGFTESPPGSLAEKLRQRGRLRVKYGVDPTAPSVTWGWGVCLRRLRRFQDLGHTAVLVIGDFTARIGDPSGRSATRRRLSVEEVERYTEACLGGLLTILSKENLEVRRNSEWLGAMGMEEVLGLAAQVTIAQLLERDDFSKRYASQEPISLIEFVYPLLQGQDSVAIEADLELGGTDQYFNLMIGRLLQQRAGQDPQATFCAPLLVGTDGRKKMSQSVGNYIGIEESAEEIFGKAMSVPDFAMSDYVRLATDLRPEEKEQLLTELSGVRLKRRLAREMAAMFHGPDAAAEAEATFDRVFVRHEAPEDVEVTQTAEHYVPRILLDLGWATSLNDARRKIKGAGIRVDGTVVADEHATLGEGSYLIQSGRRRFHRVVIR